MSFGIQFRWYSIGTVFKNQRTISTFPELAQFTGIKTMQGASDQGLFYNSTLRSLLLPANLETLGYRSLHGDSSFNMDSLVCPTTLKHLSTLNASGYIGKIVIKSQLTTFVPQYFYGSSLKGANHYTFVIDVDAVIPISGQNINMHYYYVRDNLVDAYKADSAWSSIANRIYPISELPMS